jgi:hypothetical protein
MSEEFKGIINEGKVDKADYFSIEKATKHVLSAHKKLKTQHGFYYNPTIDAVLIQSESFFILQGMKPDVYFSTIDFRRFKILFDDFANSLKVIGKKVSDKSNMNTRPAEIEKLIDNCNSSYMKANRKRLAKKEFDMEPPYIGVAPLPLRDRESKQDQGIEQ